MGAATIDAFTARRAALVLACVTAMAPVGAGARSAQLPAKLQVAILVKIFGYCKTINKDGPIRVLVVAADDSAAAVHQAFGASGVDATLADPKHALGQVASHTVVYLPVANEAVSARALELGKLTVSGDARLVRSGAVAVGLEIRKGRPKIIVSFLRLTAEKHKLSSKVLALAEVIR